MKKRIIWGIGVGIIAEELLIALVPSHSVHVGVLFGALIASLLGGRIISSLVVIVYVLGWAVAGLFILTNHYGIYSIGKNLYSVFFDYLIVLLTGIGGGWMGLLLNKWLSQRKKEKGSVESREN